MKVTIFASPMSRKKDTMSEQERMTLEQQELASLGKMGAAGA